jgi:hypothetical protein
MARSLWTIAELAWRQINPGGSDEAKNTLEEYVETAKDEFANILYQSYKAGQGDADYSLLEAFLQTKLYELKEDADGLYVELDVDVINLPNDMGVWQVRPKGRKTQPLTKTTAISRNLFDNDPTEVRSYYREGRLIRFPDGVDCPGATAMKVTLATMDDMEDKNEVPEGFATPIRNALLQKYGGTISVPSNDTNNQNANT